MGLSSWSKEEGKPVQRFLCSGLGRREDAASEIKNKRSKYGLVYLDTKERKVLFEQLEIGSSYQNPMHFSDAE